MKQQLIGLCVVIIAAFTALTSFLVYVPLAPSASKTVSNAPPALESDVLQLAKAPTIQSAKAEEVNQALSQFVVAHPGFDRLRIVDSKSRVIADSVSTGETSVFEDSHQRFTAPIQTADSRPIGLLYAHLAPAPTSAASAAAWHPSMAIWALIYGLPLILLVFSIVYIRRVFRGLDLRTEGLSHEARQITLAVAESSHISGQMAKTSADQAAAIQQTAASVDQVSAMIQKNSENARQSKAGSKKNREAAEAGQQAVQNMIAAINDINDSNNQIMVQVTESNKRIEEIVHVISEIGDKTRVINDIVFQTKLLSFNASVEAARAGEHGKGFAVVAEEVGNLAQMSGNAAKEISNLLDASVQKVQNIVSQTKSTVEGLIVTGKQKVEMGKTIAETCGESLANILQIVTTVDAMAEEISSASHEQSQGVMEISKAMNQLDQIMQQNTATAQAAAQASERIKTLSQNLEAHAKGWTPPPTDADVAAPARVPAVRAVPPLKTVSKPAAKAPLAKAVVPVATKPAQKDKNVVPFPLKKHEAAKKATTAKPSQTPRATVGSISMPAEDDDRFEDL